MAALVKKSHDSLDRYDVDAVLKENHLTAEQIVEDVLSIS